jgi:hypothetical protein
MTPTRKATRSRIQSLRDRGAVDAAQIFFILGAIVLVGFIVLWVAGRN